MWIGFIEIIANQHFTVWTCAVCLPSQRTILQIVGSNEATNAEFSAGATSQNLVFDYVWSIGVGSANLRIVNLNVPNFSTGLCIKSDQGTVVLLKHDLAITETQTTAYVVAAKHCLNGWVLFREVGPDDLLIVIQIKCVYVIWECGMHIHHVTDYQWGT